MVLTGQSWRLVGGVWRQLGKVQQLRVFLGGSVVKNPSASAGESRDEGSIPGSGSYPAEGNDNPHQYPCLENPMDRGLWRATVNGGVKNRKRLSARMAPAGAGDMGAGVHVGLYDYLNC